MAAWTRRRSARCWRYLPAPCARACSARWPICARRSATARMRMIKPRARPAGGGLPMDNRHIDPEGTRDAEALSPALRALYARLERDGALWRAQARGRIDDIDRTLKAEAANLAQSHDAARGSRGHPAPVGAESEDVAPRGTLSRASRIDGGQPMPIGRIRRRAGVISTMAAV